MRNKFGNPGAKGKWLPTLIVAIAVVLIIAGVLLLGIYFYLKLSSASRGKKQKVGNVNPMIAMRVLAGEPVAKTVQIAIPRGDLTTARMLLGVDPFMPAKDQLGLRLQLAHSYAAASGRNKEEADELYREAAAIAFLSPDLTDLMRAQTLLEIGNGYASMHMKKKALKVLAGVQELAYHSPYLQPAQRVQLVQRLRQIYGALGKKTPLTIPPGGMLQEARPVPVPLYDEVPLNEPQDLTKTKVARMNAVIKALESGNGWKAVGQALEKEDESRENAYERALKETPQMATRASWIRHRTKWLQIKLLIAQRAFGRSLVPKWEKEIPDIRYRLTKSYEDLYAVYGDQAVALPSSDQVVVGRVEILREELLDGWIGYYPNAPLDMINEDLESLLRNLKAAGDKGLYPYVDLKSSEPLPFRFAPAGASQ